MGVGGGELEEGNEWSDSDVSDESTTAGVSLEGPARKRGRGAGGVYIYGALPHPLLHQPVSREERVIAQRAAKRLPVPPVPPPPARRAAPRVWGLELRDKPREESPVSSSGRSSTQPMSPTSPTIARTQLTVTQTQEVELEQTPTQVPVDTPGRMQTRSRTRGVLIVTPPVSKPSQRSPGQAIGTGTGASGPRTGPRQRHTKRKIGAGQEYRTPRPEAGDGEETSSDEDRAAVVRVSSASTRKERANVPFRKVLRVKKQDKHSHIRSMQSSHC